MRIFRDCNEMIKELDRELYQSGISVPIKHYQNKILKGEEQFTKELMGISFTISKPYNKKDEMLEFIFKKDFKRIKKYCEQEHKDRIGGKPLNPGNSYKIRQDMWQKFMINNNSKFDYTYSERIYYQIENVLDELKKDKHSRQGLIQVFQANIDNSKLGGNTRIPCSVDYQFMIRNNRLHIIYHTRSNDYFGHFGIDIYLSVKFQEYVHNRLSEKYPELKKGSLYYFAGSLHAYKWDLSKWVIF